MTKPIPYIYNWTDPLAIHCMTMMVPLRCNGEADAEANALLKAVLNTAFAREVAWLRETNRKDCVTIRRYVNAADEIMTVSLEIVFPTTADADAFKEVF